MFRAVQWFAPIVLVFLLSVVHADSLSPSEGYDAQWVVQRYDLGLAAFHAGQYETAFRIWRELAERGYDQAQVNLGYLYSEGIGVSRDDTLAVQWFRRAAEQGNLDAKNNLGFMYALGRGTKQDPQAARRLYEDAAQAGHYIAAQNLRAGVVPTIPAAQWR